MDCNAMINCELAFCTQWDHGGNFVPDYPNTLPCPIQPSKYSPGETFTTSTFDIGVRHRKSYIGPYYVNFEFLIESREQMTAFRKFYYGRLNQGLSAFVADWDVEGSVANKEFRFSEMYRVSTIGNKRYVIQATFEMLTKIKDLV